MLQVIKNNQRESYCKQGVVCFEIKIIKNVVKIASRVRWEGAEVLVQLNKRPFAAAFHSPSGCFLIHVPIPIVGVFVKSAS